MKIFIQIFLIVATLLVLARVLAVRKTHKGGAWKKIGFIILSVLVVVWVSPILFHLLALVFSKR